MDQASNRYEELAEKWLNGTITEEELKEFSDWFNNADDNLVSIPGKFARSEEELKERIFGRIQKRTRKKSDSSYLRSVNPVTWVVAASILLACGSMTYFFLQNRQPDKPNGNETANQKSIVEGPVLPGGNKAVLILADGNEISLDAANTGTIAENSNTRITKLKDGQLACALISPNKSLGLYNTLTTPRGGQYSITLTDGTKVWLNSASSLRWPVTFDDKHRTVELTGEGYFEVALHASRPFRVLVSNMEIKVLGTHFNIMAYPDEPQLRATLLEGAVSIRHDKNSVLLIPGQQAQVGSGGKIQVARNADTEQVIAWKNGVFNFSGSDIETTMRQIARWYDVEVDYQRKIVEHFNGSIPRNASIEKVLTMLKHTGVVDFEMHSRKIFVR